MNEIVAASLVFTGLVVLAVAVFVRGGRTHDGGAPPQNAQVAPGR